MAELDLPVSRARIKTQYSTSTVRALNIPIWLLRISNTTRNTTENVNWTSTGRIESVEDDVVDGFRCQLVEKLAGRNFSGVYLGRQPWNLGTYGHHQGSSLSMTACQGWPEATTSQTTISTTLATFRTHHPRRHHK
jgi:hypothetical protein